MYISTLVCIYIHVAFGFNMAHQVPKARRNKLQLAMCTICWWLVLKKIRICQLGWRQRQKKRLRFKKKITIWGGK